MMSFNLPHPPEFFYKGPLSALSALNHDPFAEIETKVDLPIDELRKHLMLIPGAEDHDRWFQIGMALYHQFDGNDDGLALWHEWSEIADNYDAKALDKRYKSFSIDGKKRAPITARLIIKLANEAMKNKAVLFRNPEPISDNEWLYSKLHQDCIIQDLIYADVALLVAPGGVGKTTFLLFLLVHVVLGLPFIGRDIKRKSKVLFVTAEDSREILIARLRNICLEMELTELQINAVMKGVLISDVSGGPFKLTMIVGDVVTPSLQVDEIISHYEKDELSIVVFDPVVSFGVGESRVNDAEQGLVTAGRIIRNKLNCCTLFVHHTGKSNAREATIDQYSGRGGSAFSDGSRMVFVMQNLNPADWKKQTGTELIIGSESGLIFNPAKLTPTKPQEPIYLKRIGYSFKTIKRVVKDASQLVYEHADIVWKALVDELSINDKYHSKKSFEAIKGDYGLTQNECRAAFATLEAQGRIEERARPKSASRGGAYKYLHPVISDDKFSSPGFNNEPVENDEL